jgi:DNA transposition AAA+ family ATPase
VSEDQDQANIQDDERPSAARQAMDRLNDANRVLAEARMLPKNEKLTEDQIRGVVTRLKKHLEECGLPMGSAARELGYSKSTLSEWASGKYKGDIDTVTHAVNAWLERDARRRQASRPRDYVRTWIAEDIRTQCYRADKQMMMAAIVVPSGAGKTMVLKALTDELRAIYIYCHSAMTVGELYMNIALELGWKGVGKSRGALLRFIVNSLASTGRMIFLDEAHTLGPKIGYIRAIHDQAGVPVVMAGTAEILENVDDHSHGRGQFRSRCIIYNAMDFIINAERPDGKAGGRDLFTVEEIKTFFAMKQMRLEKGALDLLWAIACLPGWGCLRTVEKVAAAVFDIEPDITVITRDLVIVALESQYGMGATFIQELGRRHAEIDRAVAAA